MGGLRVFTATSGQGLLYAHEVLHAIAHMRLPVVACNVGRPSFPWNIWSDHTDSISQRDTGWIQYYGENSQETLDTIIQAYRIAEQLNLPVLVMIDAFYQSHTTENVWVPEQKLVDRFLPRRSGSSESIETGSPKAFGGLVPPKFYDRFNHGYWEDINRVEQLTNATGEEFYTHFGRRYGAVEEINMNSKTKIVLVTLASMTATARGVLPSHPEVGLLKIRLFKPFPGPSVLSALRNVPRDCKIVCVERNFTGDDEGALAREMKAALYGSSFRMTDVYAGVGGRDIPPSTFEKIIAKVSKEHRPVVWADLDE
jgi:pyruvate ferredoxin oxidoreductase alpha subunit